MNTIRRVARVLCVVASTLGASVTFAQSAVTQSAVAPATAAAPLAIGETFTVDSRRLSETRRINVYRPTVYGVADTMPLPVLYMPDGGLAEDFLHVAGLLQVLTSNGGMRPFLLVGIENTERRRDLTGPTTRAEDRKIAPRVGGSAVFRDFLRDELKPLIAQRYRVTGESAIVGESLAGLFVVETYLIEPTLFDHYFAFDPSLQWNGGQLVRDASTPRPRSTGASSVTRPTSLYVVVSGEPSLTDLAARFGRTVMARRRPGDRVWSESMPRESHATIYHPAALQAFRAVLAPPAERPAR